MEPREGGRIFSRSIATGAETRLGPHHGVGSAAAPRLRVAVHAAVGAGGTTWRGPARSRSPSPTRAMGRTHVVLEHRGFERMPDGGATMREQVDGAGGWTELLGRLRARGSLRLCRARRRRASRAAAARPRAACPWPSGPTSSPSTRLRPRAPSPPPSAPGGAWRRRSVSSE